MIIVYNTNGGEKLKKQKFYTVKEAADLLGILEQTLRNYLTQDKIKSSKVFNSTVISEEDIQRYIDQRNSGEKGNETTQL